MHSREVWCPVFNMWNFIRAKFISRTTWLSERRTKLGTSISVHVWYMTCTYSCKCVPLNMHGYIFNNTCMQMCIVEARGNHFNFWNSVSHWRWSWLIWIACWPVSTKGAGKPIFALQWWSHRCMASQSFYVGAEDLKSGPLAYTADILTIRPSPRPRNININVIINMVFL